MIGLFKRQPRPAPLDTSALGDSVVAMVAPAGSALPAGCTAVLIDAHGRARRVSDVARLAPEAGETAWLFRPGPYQVDLQPFAAAPELGLRLCFVIDAADPRVHQQRFDLYLASEAPAALLATAPLCAAMQAALQRELEQGHLQLPPCTSLAEWNAFRAGFDRLLYLRFGVTVDECLPVDLGGQVDFAALLQQRAAAKTADAGVEAAAVGAAGTAAGTAGDALAGILAGSAGAPHDGVASGLAAAAVQAPSIGDGDALRRLFLELPCLMCGLRVAVLPRGALFQRHQSLLRRLDLVSLQVTTMPALALAAPGVALGAPAQARRLAHVRRACRWLDEAWALLARMQGLDQQGAAAQACNAAAAGEGAGEGAAMRALLDEAERLVANLELDLAGRRAVLAEGEAS